MNLFKSDIDFQFAPYASKILDGKFCDLCRVYLGDGADNTAISMRLIHKGMTHTMNFHRLCVQRLCSSFLSTLSGHEKAAMLADLADAHK